MNTAFGEYSLRALTEEDYPSILSLSGLALYGTMMQESEAAPFRELFEFDRCWGAFSGAELVGYSSILSRTLVIPGGHLPVAGYSAASVSMAHRRRGLLRALGLMQAQSIYERQTERVAAASFFDSSMGSHLGFGLACQMATSSFNAREVRFSRAESTTSGVDVLLGSDSSAGRAIADIYRAYAELTPGCFSRDERWWRIRLLDLSRDHGQGSVLVAIHRTGARLDGYAVFSIARGVTDLYEEEAAISVREIIALTNAAESALLNLICSIDLAKVVTIQLDPASSPLRYLADHPRRLQTTLSKALWLRIGDVGRALEVRKLEHDLAVVIDVVDKVLPWGGGTWLLVGGPDGADCVKTNRSPDIRLDSSALASVYLGGASLLSLAKAGQVEELTTGTLRRMSQAFSCSTPPECYDFF